jgi:tetratricopeptide (TPR) repeat protein
MAQIAEAVEVMIRTMDQDYSVENLAHINKTAVELGNDGNPAAAQRLLECALKAYEAHYTANTFNFSVLMYNLGLQLHTQKSYDAARIVYERALVSREQYFGPDSPQLVDCLEALGQLSVAVDLLDGNRIAARRLFERSLSLREKSTAVENLDMANCLLRLASTYNHFAYDDDQVKKIRLIKRALGIFERECGDNDVQTAHVLLNHLVLASLPGDMGEVREYLRRALDILEGTESGIQSMKKSLRTLFLELRLFEDGHAQALRQRLDAVDKTILEGV